MAPGAKKKNSNRRTVDNQLDTQKSSENNLSHKRENSLDTCVKKEPNVEPIHNKGQDKKYSKRVVASNWQKYEEVPSDPHADTMRGKDFEVLLSYSGGSGSQLRLQDEKEWEEAVEEKTIALDIKDVIHIVKTVPFHEQLNLSTNVFSETQLARFNSSAKIWKESYKPQQNDSVNVSLAESKSEMKKIPTCLDSTLQIIDDSILDEEEKAVPDKPISEKTESIIESLASCLSLKAPVPDKKSILKEETKKETSHFSDDLDFLLSLNVSLKNPVPEEKQKETTKTNVDDWLNSLLDD